MDIDFHTLPVSTRTFVLYTNRIIPLAVLFENLPITPFQVIAKPKGRKPKSSKSQESIFSSHTITSNDSVASVPYDPCQLSSGSIVTVEMDMNMRGANLKDKEFTGKNFFRNCVTVVMAIDGKFLNLKVCRNGKVHATGCKTEQQALQSVIHLDRYISEFPGFQPEYTRNPGMLDVIVEPAMRNVKFTLGYQVNSQKLDTYINQHTEYTSQLETSKGCTGVNVSIPLRVDIFQVQIARYIINKEGQVNETSISYIDYINLLPQKDRQKKLTKALDKHSTFLVFQTGKVIPSSMNVTTMIDTFNEFIELMKACRNIVEERIIS